MGRASIIALMLWAAALLGAPAASADNAAEPQRQPRLATALPGSSMLATFRIENWLKEEIPGGDYAAELVRAYQERAREEAGFAGRGRTNWFDATAFFAKGRRAAQGEETPPWSPRELGLSSALLMASYRATLRRSIRYRKDAPDACAQMVALFDHWIERQRDLALPAPAKGRFFQRWAEAFRACGGSVEIMGFPIGACANTDDDARLSDAPARNLKQRRELAVLAEELGQEEKSGVLWLVGAKLRISGYASASRTSGGGEKLAECRARFVEKALIDAGVAPARLKLLTKGAIGSGEAYRHRKVTVSLD